MYLHGLLLLGLIACFSSHGPNTLARADCVPSSGCNVALAYYSVSANETLSLIATRFQTTYDFIQQYSSVQDVNSLKPGQILLVPFPCECNGDQLGHLVPYQITAGDNFDAIVKTKFNNLSQTDWVTAANPGVDPTNLSPGSVVNIPLNCSCGNPDVSTKYGLFATYVIKEGNTLSQLSTNFSIDSDDLTAYNPSIDWNNLLADEDIIFIPEKDGNDVYPPFNTSANDSGSLNKAALAGGLVGGVIVLGAVFVLYVYIRKTRHNNIPEPIFTTQHSSLPSSEILQAHIPSRNIASSPFTYPVGKAVEFSYKELAEITGAFSDSAKIGQGGFGAVYYGEIHGQKVAIKRMDIEEKKQFIAELMVLTKAHHVNLVQLVGYCTEHCLCLVYEYVENKTLKHHLEAGSTPLTWASRVQIAIDAGRALEYIHEYASPSYVHLDIKPENILLDINLRAKVADFGLAKLSEAIGTKPLGGTFGYMPPEYLLLGEISPKADVYAFGVVLMQLISAKQAIITDASTAEVNRTPLPSLFKNVLTEADDKESLMTLVDPGLGDSYPLDSVWKIAELAVACTDNEPNLRPSMQTIVNKIGTLTPFTKGGILALRELS